MRAVFVGLVLAAATLLDVARMPAFSLDYLDCNTEASKEQGGRGVEVCSQLIATRRWTGLELARLYSNRSLAYQKRDKLDLALDDANQAIKLAPNYVYAYDNRAEIKRMRKQYDAALADFGTAIRLDPEFLSAYYDRGETYREMGDRKRARADYETVGRLPGKGRSIDVWAKDKAREALAALGAGD